VIALGPRGFRWGGRAKGEEGTRGKGGAVEGQGPRRAAGLRESGRGGWGGAGRLGDVRAPLSTAPWKKQVGLP
jgi:hypothetical protein